MTRTETDLRTLYASLAQEAEEPRLVSRPEQPPAHLAGPVFGELTIGQQPAPPRARPHRRRLLAGAAIAGLATAAAVAAAMLVPSGHAGYGPSTAGADPVTVLRQAAAYTLSARDATPRADQFLYVSSEGTERWISVDGTHDGLTETAGSAPMVQSGCRRGIAMVPGNYAGTRAVSCTPDPAYLPDAPTSAPAMLAYLQSHYGKAGANGIGKAAFDLLSFHVLPSAARAAIFEAMSQVPGLHVVRTSEFSGQPTIGVSWSVLGPDNMPAQGDQSTLLIFDAQTHEFLTIRTTGVNGEAGGGDTVSAVVDRVGQRP